MQRLAELCWIGQSVIRLFPLPLDYFVDTFFGISQHQTNIMTENDSRLEKIYAEWFLEIRQLETLKHSYEQQVQIIQERIKGFAEAEQKCLADIEAEQQKTDKAKQAKA